MNQVLLQMTPWEFASREWYIQQGFAGWHWLGVLDPLLDGTDLGGWIHLLCPVALGSCVRERSWRWSLTLVAQKPWWTLMWSLGQAWPQHQRVWWVVTEGFWFDDTVRGGAGRMKSQGSKTHSYTDPWSVFKENICYSQDFELRDTLNMILIASSVESPTHLPQVASAGSVSVRLRWLGQPGLTLGSHYCSETKVC